ncbi:uncharacterized protein [Argopecten irradians]|uniref:uncharacterized protein n=1 Tax=Argopecten irradians TaxID=31199 RepID=UPI003713CB38
MNIEQEAVSKILKNLKPDKSPGLDELQPMFLKNTSDTISYPITKLFNQSISTGTLPDDWKKARVCAIFKKGDKCEPGNYSHMKTWISSFLKGRHQMVTMNDKNSEWSSVTSGIPQGSVLGPLLFVIFVNDLPDIVQSDVYLFVDDTKIFKAIRGKDDALDLQSDLDTMSKWSETWLLKIHPDKCKHMRIHKQRTRTNVRKFYNTNSMEKHCNI